MILLLELHGYRYKDEEIAFYPCGKPNSEGKLEDDRLLLRIIDYSHCIGASGFRNTVGRFLSGTDLSGANLSGANLSGVDLSFAFLSDEEWGDIQWDLDTNWENVRGLETAVDIPEALRQHLGL